MGWFGIVKSVVANRWTRKAICAIDNIFRLVREGIDVKAEIRKAWADGRITEEEIRTIRDELDDVLNEGLELAKEIAQP